MEPGDIVDCNESNETSTSLSTKRYRMTPKESAMQYTVHCGFRDSVQSANGQTYGMFPMLIQSKYRIDEKRPMQSDGVTEKKPWSK